MDKCTTYLIFFYRNKFKGYATWRFMTRNDVRGGDGRQCGGGCSAGGG